MALISGAHLKFHLCWNSFRLFCYFLLFVSKLLTRSLVRWNNNSSPHRQIGVKPGFIMTHEFSDVFQCSSLKYAKTLQKRVTINRRWNITETDYVHSRESERPPSPPPTTITTTIITIWVNIMQLQFICFAYILLFCKQRINYQIILNPPCMYKQTCNILPLIRNVIALK